ncbi:hypothetical protein RB195_002777 [Necator americanus]|uniref:ATP-dependent DNA helicase n=1 Tax=Necator americanus TaxID=51031 RepID=A0ABR1DLB5_NECAM
MAPKCTLEAIEGLICGIMQNDRPFGGKPFIIGGNFLQELQIVEQGQHDQITLLRNFDGLERDAIKSRDSRKLCAWLSFCLWKLKKSVS